MTDREAMNLPPMPGLTAGFTPGTTTALRLCDEPELLAWGAACYAAAMEAAAKVCDEVARDTNLSPRARCASERSS